MKSGFHRWFALLLLAAIPAFAGLKDSDCLDCHGDNTLFKTNSAGRAISLFVDKAKLALSAHSTNTCIHCHADVYYYEAVLACLAIVVWHFYHVMFDPDVYPLNTACLDGRISEELQAHEHPLENAIEDPTQNDNDSP